MEGLITKAIEKFANVKDLNAKVALIRSELRKQKIEVDTSVIKNRIKLGN